MSESTTSELGAVKFGIASTAAIAKNKVIPALLAVDSAELVAVSLRGAKSVRERLRMSIFLEEGE